MTGAKPELTELDPVPYLDVQKFMDVNYTRAQIPWDNKQNERVSTTRNLHYFRTLPSTNTGNTIYFTMVHRTFQFRIFTKNLLSESTPQLLAYGTALRPLRSGEPNLERFSL